MKVSLNQIKQFIDFELPPVDELVDRINQQLGGVEEVIALAAKYHGATVVRVVSVEKHPDADKLSVCLVDDGGVTNDIERDENGYVQVVCGAPNVHADMWAVWLPPRTTVPASVNDAEPFVLDVRKLRGVMSNGMLAAGDELGINHDHEGIIELTEADLPPQLNGRGLAAGQDFAELFGLDDVVIDIENKMFTHRPDLFGQLGVAREIAGILGHQFTSPSWYADVPEFVAREGLALETFNDAQQHVPRVMFAAMKDVTIAPSPLWIQTALVAMGSKPVNNIVDITNYVMLLTAQPTHAYDYDKLRGHKIGARMARDGETIKLLNDKTYELTSDDIVIADAEGPVGLGGIMGGADSEVDEHSKNIVLEVATFDMYAVRKSAMRHGVFTDALTRFNKGQSPLQNDHVMSILLASIKDVSPAEQASEVFDNRNFDDRISDFEVETNVDFINKRLGLSLSDAEVQKLLENTEINVSLQDSKSEIPNPKLSVRPPFWRTDLELPEDVVEEVGRLYGFEKLSRTLPNRSSAPASYNAALQLKSSLRDSLSRAGANEVLTYSFIHENLMTRSTQDPARAFRLSNALSPDLQYYRLSVLPSLLDKVHMNIKLGYDEFALFEIGMGHDKTKMSDHDTLPVEYEMCDVVYASKTAKSGAPYYQVRRLATQIADDLKLSVVFVPLAEDADDPILAPFDPRRSAEIQTRDGVSIGVVGELKAGVRKAFKLPDYTSAMSLSLAPLQESSRRVAPHYQPLSRFPSTSRDISVRTAADISYSTLYHTIWQTIAERANGMDITLTPVGIYQGDNDSTKTTTLHIIFTNHEKTLEDTDITPIIEHVSRVVRDDVRGELV